MSNLFGWDYPPGAANDPRAPWNKPDDHCTCCPCHEGSDWEPTCSECEGGVCYIYEFLPRWLALRIGGWMPRWDGRCTLQEEPPCKCDECTCAEDADADRAEALADARAEMEWDDD